MIQFTIHFRSPFRIGGSEPVDLFDAPVNRDNPLPQSSLKGLMRAEARERLGIDEHRVDAVFGSRRAPSPWWWSPASLEETGFAPTTKVRVDEAGRSMRGFLRFGEQVWASRGHFSVEPIGRVAADEMDDHRAILIAAASSITSLGESRLRGSGWVEIRCDAAVPPDLPRRILALSRGVAR